jgi:hypothetical protein
LNVLQILTTLELKMMEGLAQDLTSRLVSFAPFVSLNSFLAFCLATSYRKT